ncbi:MAG: hypothetical protein NTW76_09095 [Corynebacteriales bacterium]|nr:hypothetical protein [Mycobacteriales bacterium]
MDEQTTMVDEIDSRDDDRREWRSVNAVVMVLALLTCLFVIALPLLGSLALAGAVLGLFTGAGLATIFVLSRVQD